MGFYINPHDMTKEEFLVKYGVRMSQEEVANFNFAQEDTLPVVLIDNRAFTAAGIAYDTYERDAFNDKQDPRSKVWFKVSKEDLKPFME